MAASPRVPDDLQPVRNANYDAWVRGFRARAANQGISQSTLDAGFRGAGYLPGVVKRDRNQTEFNRTLEDYLAIAASDERVTKGRAAFARHRGTLSAIEAKYGVPAQIVAAIWGLESFFGERRGDVSVVAATSTLAFDGRRGQFFEEQLIAALRILQSGDISAQDLKGSWAGAMGHTQFIPTSYQSFAVDFTGDGRRDIWSDDPTDALASTAAARQSSRSVKTSSCPGAPTAKSGLPDTESWLTTQSALPVFPIVVERLAELPTSVAPTCEMAASA